MVETTARIATMNDGKVSVSSRRIVWLKLVSERGSELSSGVSVSPKRIVWLKPTPLLTALRCYILPYFRKSHNRYPQALLDALCDTRTHDRPHSGTQTHESRCVEVQR